MTDGSQFAAVIVDGSMWAALPVALLAGAVSFVSPCVLPLVPGYLGYITGLTGVDLERQKRGRMVCGVMLFIAGFSAVFVLMSVVFARLGALPWLRGQSWVMIVLGVLVVLLGVVFMGGFNVLQRERKIHHKPPPGLWGAPLLGATFGLGWAPCIGPTFAAVQMLAYSGGSSVNKAVVLTVAYCLGLGIPFLCIALAFRRGMGAVGYLRKHRLLLQRTGGAVLIVVGLLMITGLWDAFVSWVQAELVQDFMPVV